MDIESNNKKFDWIYDRDAKYKPNFSGSRALGMREQLEWIKRQLEYSVFCEKYRTRYDCKKGEIYEIDWGVNVNAEFSLRHYGVVLADSGPFNPLVVVCPLKSNHQGAHPRSDYSLGFIPELNNAVPTLAVVNQIRTVDKLRIFTKNAISPASETSVGEQEIAMPEIEINPTTNGAIPRLNEEKVNMIIQLYIANLMGV